MPDDARRRLVDCARSEVTVGGKMSEIMEVAGRHMVAA